MNIIDEAFRSVPRQNFLPPGAVERAGIDAPIAIGHGQTNSQPTTVRMMLEWLDARPGQKVLDVGSGSGWTTALLSYIVGLRGKVIAIEKVLELLAFGRENCGRLNIRNVEFHQAGTVFGWPDLAPYDRILVSAAAHELPIELVQQLAAGGRMVIPVGYSILLVQKLSDGKIELKEFPGFTFVPLV